MLPGQHYDPPAGAVLRLGNRVQGKYPTDKPLKHKVIERLKSKVER